MDETSRVQPVLSVLRRLDSEGVYGSYRTSIRGAGHKSGCQELQSEVPPLPLSRPEPFFEKDLLYQHREGSPGFAVLALTLYLEPLPGELLLSFACLSAL